VRATRFATDALGGRVAIDPVDVRVEGKARRVRVEPLPTEGRPKAFLDAVGRFTVRATAEPRTVPVNGTLRLTLTIEGEGNLPLLTPPRLDDLDGFHRYGVLDDRGAERRTVRYEIAPVREDVAAVPPIAFAFYDPDPRAGWREVRAEAIPITVTRAAAPPAAASTDGGGGARWLPIAAGALVAFLVALAWRRRRAARPGAPAAESPPTDAGEAFLARVAERLGTTRAAVVSPDLAARLVARGVAPDVARRVAAAAEAVVAARYGGPPVDREALPPLAAAGSR
jgi:hypothetical protein